VLRLEAGFAPSLLGFGAALLQKLEFLSHCHRREKLTLGGISI
jgi:hypothetical protein